MDDIVLLEKILLRCADPAVALTPMLWGKHGIAKSAIVKQVFETKGYTVHDIRLGQVEVGDLIGMPAQEYFCPRCETSYGQGGNFTYCLKCKTEDGTESPLAGRTTWLKPWWFPKQLLDGTWEKVALFFDEANRGRLDVQQAFFQIALDRKVYQHALPEGTVIVCAANPSGGEYNVEEIDPALLDRFVNIKWTLLSGVWIKWAEKNGIHRSILRFINNDPKYLGNEPVEIPIEILPTPRSYEFLSKMISPEPKETAISDRYWQEIANMIIGPDATLAFIQSIKEDIEKPIKAIDILKRWTKVENDVIEQVEAEDGVRFDLLRATLDDLGDLLKEGKSKTYSVAELNNLGNFILLLPKDLGFAAIKEFAKEQDIQTRLLHKRSDLFDYLKSARDYDKVV